MRKCDQLISPDERFRIEIARQYDRVRSPGGRHQRPPANPLAYFTVDAVRFVTLAVVHESWATREHGKARPGHDLDS